jgi:hypothetical protein
LTPIIIMRGLALLPLLALSAAAVPANELQAILGELGGYTDLSNNILGGIAKGVERVAHKAEETVEQWLDSGREFVKQNGLTCEWSS